MPDRTGHHARVWLRIVVFVGVSVPSLNATSASKSGTEFFENRIRPLLAKNCLSCHSQTAMGGLRLDSRDHLLKGGKDGPVVVPWHPNESVLIQAVRRTHERFKMPPQAPLSDDEVASLTAWVKAGAVWPETEKPVLSSKPGEYVITTEQRAFWSFQPVRKPPVPRVRNSAGVRNDIDRFILARLEQKGLKPVRPADKRVLIRRATYDLIGLPPTPEEVDAFVRDASPNAFAKVVDRLLASPHYGERWGRYWLDYARYADEKFTRGDSLYANAFRYRDWVIQAFNDDMSYDLFVKAQIAADLLNRPDRDKLLPALGLYGLTSQEGDDRVDVTARTFLGLTVACARCHDHKFDPIPTKDYYSLLGIFRSTKVYEIPLAPGDVVKKFDDLKAQIKDQKAAINDFIEKQASQLCEILSHQISRYVVASWKIIQSSANPDAVARESNLDRTTLDRWVKYLSDPAKDHSYLDPWFALLKNHPGLEEVRKFADEFQSLVLSFNAEKKAMDDRNYVALGGAQGAKDTEKRQYTNIETLEIKKYYLWRDLESEPYTREAVKFDSGVLYYGPKDIDRWLPGEWKNHLDLMRSQLAALEKALPKQYPFLHAIRDGDKPANVRVEVRGEGDNLGEEAPRRFLLVLCKGEPPHFKNGSGRLELAEAIASPTNPLTARVMVNRIWAYHFGAGIVGTVSNFGQLGDRPSHPELLDYLASQFVEAGWSIKALHREVMLSATYALSSEEPRENMAADPDNRLLWRANVRPRLDIEALRDSLLAVAGRLDLTIGGPPAKLTDDNRRRTVYGFISRNKLDPTLELFDFPDPNTTSESRNVTAGPLQRLYFLNNGFVEAQAKAFAARIAKDGGDDSKRIRHAYHLLFGRAPTENEVHLGKEFLKQGEGRWQQYAQVLLSSTEFSSVN